MNIQKIIYQVNEIFKEVLDDDTLNIDFNSTADDVEDWDSLNHILLIVEIEKKFKINFTSQEIHSYMNVGAMSEDILKKIK